MRSPDFAEMPSWRQWEVLGKAAVKVMEPYEALAYSPEEVADAIQREGNFLRYILTKENGGVFRHHRLVGGT